MRIMDEHYVDDFPALVFVFSLLQLDTRVFLTTWKSTLSRKPSRRNNAFVRIGFPRKLKAFDRPKCTPKLTSTANLRTSKLTGRLLVLFRPFVIWLSRSMAMAIWLFSERLVWKDCRLRTGTFWLLVRGKFVLSSYAGIVVFKPIKGMVRGHLIVSRQVLLPKFFRDCYIFISV